MSHLTSNILLFFKYISKLQIFVNNKANILQCIYSILHISFWHIFLDGIDYFPATAWAVLFFFPLFLTNFNSNQRSIHKIFLSYKFKITMHINISSYPCILYPNLSAALHFPLVVHRRYIAYSCFLKTMFSFGWWIYS